MKLSIRDENNRAAQSSQQWYGILTNNDRLGHMILYVRNSSRIKTVFVRVTKQYNIFWLHFSCKHSEDDQRHISYKDFCFKYAIERLDGKKDNSKTVPTY